MEDFRGRLVVVRSSGIDKPLRLAKPSVGVLEHFLHSVGTFAISLCRLSFGLCLGLANLLCIFIDSQSRGFLQQFVEGPLLVARRPTVWSLRIANRGE